MSEKHELDFRLVEMSKESLLDKIRVSSDQSWLRFMANCCCDTEVIRTAANRAFDLMQAK